MNSKMDTNIYLLLLCLFALVACYLEPYLILPALIILGLTYYFAQQNFINKEIFFSSYLDNIIRNIERTNHFAVRKLDIGMAVFSKDGKLQWKNNLFQEWVGQKNLEGKSPEQILPLEQNAFSMMLLRDGQRTIRIEDRYYVMKYCRVQTQEKSSGQAGANISGLMLYMTDITELELLKQKYGNDKLCLAYANFDNYDDVTRGLSDTNVANLTGEVNEALTKWVAEQHGFICRMNKESCLIGLSQASVLDLIEDKFTILDRVREIRCGNKIAPTLSIGVACDGLTLEELRMNASKALTNAKGRGGDQAVVVRGKNILYFGGTSAVSSTFTRVRARTVAQAIREQMQQADKIFVMGHKDEDFDAIGGAIGVAKLALSLKKETYIVISGQNASFKKIARFSCTDGDCLFKDSTSYTDIMLEEAEALPHITPGSLLVIVDHHRAVLSASREVLEKITRRIIIDHHRRAEDLIANHELLYLEPSSSSTSELVTELTGYFDDRLEFSPSEATALYAGIVLDTKNFTVQVGERTFEAAALLRRSGADPNLVRAMFKDDMQTVLERVRIMSGARLPAPGVAVCVYPKAEPGARSSVLAAQTADTLITIEGVAAGFAIVEYKDGSLSVSARSDGSVNVQLIMEELGGGGHQTVAGVQLKGKHARDVEPQIVALAKKQLEERDNNESDSAARC